MFLVSTPAIMYLVNYYDLLPRPWRVLATAAIATIAFSVYDLMGRAAYGVFMSLSVITVCYLVVLAALGTLRARARCLTAGCEIAAGSSSAAAVTGRRGWARRSWQCSSSAAQIVGCVLAALPRTGKPVQRIILSILDGWSGAVRPSASCACCGGGRRPLPTTPIRIAAIANIK